MQCLAWFLYGFVPGCIRGLKLSYKDLGDKNRGVEEVQYFMVSGLIFHGETLNTVILLLFGTNIVHQDT